MRHCGGAERLRFIPISKDAFGFTSAINHTSFSTGKFQIKVDRFAKALYNSIRNRIACIIARKRRLIKGEGNRTLTVTFSNDTPEAMAELICLALDLKKTRQDNMILLFN